ncbi:MAG: DUF4097 family beta strand repeat-containing protein [Eubacterium sp.]
MKNKHNVNPLLHAILPLVITIAYVIIGFVFDTGWAIGWILFLLIPIIETLINAINTKNPSHFAYPVLVTAIFLFTGMMWGLWHPLWVLFVTIPVYYAICDAVKKSKPEQNVEYQPQMTDSQQPQPNQPQFYPPQANMPYQQKSSNNSTAIIITVIVSVAAVAIVAIICTFSWLSGNFNIPAIVGESKGGESYAQGSVDIATDNVENIDVEWVSGNIDVQYYDGDTIYIEESAKNDRHPMTYKVEGRTLYICEFGSNVSTAFSSKSKKDLTIKIPNDFKTNELSLDIVSADVTVSNLNTRDLELNAVSGNAHISFKEQPRDIEMDTVSGDIQLVFPEDISGFSISNESVSGKINTNDFGNVTYYGDGYTEIELDAVSGNLTVETDK